MVLGECLLLAGDGHQVHKVIDYYTRRMLFFLFIMYYLVTLRYLKLYMAYLEFQRMRKGS